MSVKTKVFHQKVRLVREKYRNSVLWFLLVVLVWAYLIGGICEMFSGRSVSIEVARAAELADIVIEAPIQEKKQESIEEMIYRIADEEGFQGDKKNLIKLASCESYLQPDNSHRNTDPRKTLDRGLWMYNDYWRADVSDKCAYDAECSTRQAVKDINAGKLDKWYCSGVWDKPFRNI